MWLLLLPSPAQAAPPARWGIADRDAGCALVAVEAALDIELDADAAFDAFIGELLPYAANMPMPAECADRVSVYVDDVDATDVTVCARITAGPGLGRAFCSALDARVVEAPDEVLADPVEPGGGVAGGPIGPPTVDVGRPPPRVVEGTRDGRVVAVLDASQTLACAYGLLGAVATAEVSYDAAFDAYATDLDALGFALDGPRGSCQAYVGVRVASETWPDDFRVEAVIVEGSQRGRGFAMGADLVVEDAGPVPGTRTRLQEQGWTLGDRLPR